MTKRNENLAIAYLAWGAAALFYFYQYIIRILPGVVGDYMKQDFLLSAEQFGLVGSLTLYAYAFVQIPLGILLDKYGIKKVIVSSIIICFSGCALMSFAHNVYWLYCARIIIGMGSGSAFIVCMKIVSDYLPEGKRGFLIGGTLTIGTLGAIVFSRPIAMMSKYFGWLEICFYIALVGLIVLAAALLLIPSYNGSAQAKQKERHILLEILSVLKNKYVVIYSIIAIGAYTPMTVLSDLWGPSFIKIKFFLNNTDAASANTTLFIGLAVGSLVLPWFFEKLKRIDIGITISSVFIFISYVVLLYFDSSSLLILTICLFFIGFWCGSEMLCFTGVARYLKPENSGLAIGVVNTFNMLGSAMLQHAVGTVMDNKWGGQTTSDGLRLYTLDNYVDGLSLILVLVIITFVLSLFLRDKESVK
jgi:predicted MFS family arabinose efflux permease